MSWLIHFCVGYSLFHVTSVACTSPPTPIGSLVTYSYLLLPIHCFFISVVDLKYSLRQLIYSLTTRQLKQN